MIHFYFKISGVTNLFKLNLVLFSLSLVCSLVKFGEMRNKSKHNNIHKITYNYTYS